jgi:translation initiation factor 3 subunit A
MQVAQLEKEKKELNERLRIVAKRVDHIERAYRKEERPLLGQDYDQQQSTARETFAAIQTARKESARVAHEEDLETKKRLARMMSDYEARRAVVLAKKGEEYAKKKDAASRKIEEEKAKRKKAVLAKREEERKAIEEAKRKEQEKIEEERRLEAGKFFVFTLSSFVTVLSQNASQKQTVFAPKKRPPKPPPKPQNARQRKKPSSCARRARRSAPRRWRRRASSSSAKTKPRPAGKPVPPKNPRLCGNPSSPPHRPPSARRRGPPAMGHRRVVFGDAAVERQQDRFLSPPRAPGRSPAPRRAQRVPLLLLPSTFLGRYVVPRRVDGEIALPLVQAELHLLASALLHPHLLQHLRLLCARLLRP